MSNQNSEIIYAVSRRLETARQKAIEQLSKEMALLSQMIDDFQIAELVFGAPLPAFLGQCLVSIQICN